jgi:biopolymer transport protein ExbB
MNSIESIIKFFQDCGLFIFPSLAIMATGLAIAVERFVFLQKARVANRKDWSKVLPLLQGGQWKEVMGLTAASDSAIGKIVHNGLSRLQSSRRRDDIDAAMEEGMMEIVPRLEKRTHYIAVFANVITLVGLLGTMNNTAFALMVAIPFLLIHSFLQARTADIVDGLEAAKISFLNLVQRLAPEHKAA